ncbi:ABC transporter substrate-binding protein [Phreatobacter sp. AB_2022a]|uniref:ABC transporter substrate-binding protein n=1 Tax=Phreatobacter sp. AB_2022a TaxID=3003134 RepID=UPI0022873391|nr:ABC transporter substrate-binding protein [Phreatobacter sp. AB_2022a]MCZ0734229.1 ABC transporter substrate-binding protein [Phreatobacter sp. AB_2022a]
MAKQSINRRQALSLAAGAIALPASIRADPFLAPARIVCGSVPYLSSGGFFVPLAKGYYRKLALDIDVRNFVDGGLAMPALAAGEIDISTAPCNAGFFNLVAKGAAVRIFMDRGHEARGRGSQAILVSNSLHADGFTNLDGYRLAKGKVLSIAVMGSVAHYLHAQALQRVGLSFADLELRTGLNSSTALQLMASGRVDIVLDPMPGGHVAEARGIGRIATWSDEIAPGMQLSTFAAGERFLKERRSAAVRFCMATLQGYREFNAAAASGDPAIIKLLAAETRLPEELLQRTRPRWSTMAEDGAPNRDAILAQQRFWHERTDLLVRPAPVEQLFETSVLAEAQQRLAADNPFL